MLKKVKEITGAKKKRGSFSVRCWLIKLALVTILSCECDKLGKCKFAIKHTLFVAKVFPLHEN